MVFKVSLPELDSTYSQYAELIPVFEAALEDCHNAVMSLSGSGWTGIAQTQFYEKFYVFIQSGGKFLEKLAYMGDCIDICAQMTEVLKAQYEHLPLTVGAEAGVSNGTVFLDQAFEPQVFSFAKSLFQVEWPEMKNSLSTTRDAVGALQYRPFAIHADLGSQVSDLNLKAEKLEQLSLEFSEYSKNVSDFEEQNTVRFEYVKNSKFNFSDATTYLDYIGWTDLVGFKLDTLDASLRKAFVVPGSIVTKGKYTYYSDFPKGTYSGLYLTTSLQNNDYQAASNAFRLNRALNVANKAMTGISAAVSGYEEFNRNPYMPMERRVINTYVAAVSDVGIALAGAKIGAAFGTLIPIPVVGTVVGAFAGAVIAVGFHWATSQRWFGGKSIKEHVSDGVNAYWDHGKAQVNTIAQGLSTAWGWLTGTDATGSLQPETP